MTNFLISFILKPLLHGGYHVFFSIVDNHIYFNLAPVNAAIYQKVDTNIYGR